MTNPDNPGTMPTPTPPSGSTPPAGTTTGTGTTTTTNTTTSGTQPARSQNQHHQASATGGGNTLLLSLSVGGPLLVLISAGLFWYFWRKKQIVLPAIIPNKASATSTKTFTPWVSSSEMGSPLPSPLPAEPAPVATPISPLPALEAGALLPDLTSDDTLGALSDKLPALNLLQDATQEAYTPSDLRPITMSLPSQLPQPRLSATIYPATSDMSPLPIDALEGLDDQAQTMEAMSALPQTPPPDELDFQTLAATPSTPPAPPVPSLLDDPMLEAVMRQAQTGLFVLPDQEHGLEPVKAE